MRGADIILNRDKCILVETIKEFENCDFYKTLDKKELEKIYKADKKRYCWRFFISKGVILPLKITDLIKHTCPTKAFINMYRYTSIHTHTNFFGD